MSTVAFNLPEEQKPMKVTLDLGIPILRDFQYVAEQSPSEVRAESWESLFKDGVIQLLQVDLDSWSTWISELDDPSETVRHDKIEQSDLPDKEPYKIIQDIPVTVTRSGELDFVASFEKANIAIGGVDFHDAFQALVYEILDVFDFLTTNSDILGPEPEKQLALLNKHIVKTHS